MQLLPRADVLFGTVIFTVVNCALGYASYVASFRMLPAARTGVRCVASAVLGAAAIILLAQFLSLFGMYSRGAATAVTLALAFAAYASRASSIDAGADLLSAGNAFRTVARSRGAGLLVLGSVALALVAWRGLERPPLGWDSLTYHLTFAGLYVQTGRLSTIAAPFGMDVYTHLPKNGEILASWLMLPFHGDLLVGLMNVALLVFGWLATWTLGRELDLEVVDAALAATAVCASPFLFSYVTTQYPDTLVFGTLVSAALFIVRYARRAEAGDAFLVCAAAGIAAGTTYAGVPLAVLAICGVAVAAAVTHTRAPALPRLALWILVGGVTVGTLGGRQYVLNASETGNPIYPLGIAVAGRTIFHETPYSDRLAADKGTGDRRSDLSQLIKTFNYFPDWRTPTSAGPKYLLLIPLALLAVFRRRGTWVVPLLVGGALLACVATYLPATGFAALSRRHWPGSAPRFLAVPFAIFTLVGLADVTRRWVSRGDALRAILTAFIVWDFLVADVSVTGKLPLELGVITAVFFVVALASREIRRVGPALVSVAVASAVLIGVPLLSERRAQSRWWYFANAADVHFFPREYVPGWDYCDKLAAPATIALTGDWDFAGQNQFFYPLMGSRLQNTVTYVPLRKDQSAVSRDFVLRQQADFQEWADGLRTRAVSLVFVQAPWPIEDAWMRERAQTFPLLSGGTGYRLYAVRTPAGAAGS
jgi:hypothetical protein